MNEKVKVRRFFSFNKLSQSIICIYGLKERYLHVINIRQVKVKVNLDYFDYYSFYLFMNCLIIDLS